MKALMIFTFSVLCFFVANTFHAKTNASVYENGINSLMSRNNPSHHTYGRAPAVLPKGLRSELMQQNMRRD